MKRTRLLSLSLTIVLAGLLDLSRPREVGATDPGSFYCVLCVPPPVFCIDHHEWDDVCKETCGASSEAVQCPAAGPECPPTDDVLFCTGN